MTNFGSSHFFRGIVFRLIFAVFSGLSIMESSLGQTRGASGTSTCDSPATETSQLQSWIQSLDLVGQSFLRTPESGDTRLASGGLVAESCFQGLNTAQRAVLLSEFSEVINRSIVGAELCNQTLRLPGANDVISILRRTRFECSSGIGSNFIAVNRPVHYDPFVSPFGVVTTGYDRSYSVIIQPESLASLPIDDLAAFMFHEGFHSTASNNRSWHDHPLDGHFASGCSNSIFEDRVYLTHAACFPQSGWGRYFYLAGVGAVNCPGVCERALTRSDPGQGFTSSWQSGGLGGTVGPPLQAVALSAGDASAVCSRIRSVQEIGRRLNEELETASRRYQLVTNSSIFPTSAHDQGRQLRSAFREIHSTFGRAYEVGADIDSILADFRQKKGALLSSLESTCANSSALTEWRSFCDIQGAPLVDAVTQFEALLTGLKQHDSAQAAAGLPSVSQVRLFWRGQSD